MSWIIISPLCHSIIVCGVSLFLDHCDHLRCSPFLPGTCLRARCICYAAALLADCRAAGGLLLLLGSNALDCTCRGSHSGTTPRPCPPHLMAPPTAPRAAPRAAPLTICPCWFCLRRARLGLAARWDQSLSARRPTCDNRSVLVLLLLALSPTRIDQEIPERMPHSHFRHSRMKITPLRSMHTTTNESKTISFES